MTCQALITVDPSYKVTPIIYHPGPSWSWSYGS